MPEMPPSGGTELLMNALQQKSTLDARSNLNMILSIPDLNKIKYSKQNILWQHLNHREPTLANLNNKEFTNSVDAFVYVSNWQYEKFSQAFNVPSRNAHVIKNAIDQIDFIEKPKDKIKLIYTSTPWRGLDVLLDSFERLNRDDVELDVYSSTIIYGSGFSSFIGDQFDSLFERAKSMKNVNYIGYATNDEVRKAVQESHILAYPSIFEETSCLSVIEAGAAGCKIVSTNLGALPETCSEYATLIPIQKTKDTLVINFTEALNNAIDTFWDKETQNLLKIQSDFYNNFYSWDKRLPEWERLFDKLS